MDVGVGGDEVEGRVDAVVAAVGDDDPSLGPAGRDGPEPADLPGGGVAADGVAGGTTTGRRTRG